MLHLYEVFLTKGTFNKAAIVVASNAESAITLALSTANAVVLHQHGSYTSSHVSRVSRGAEVGAVEGLPAAK